MKSNWYIMVLYKIGNIGSDDIRKLKNQPEEGFNNENEAHHHLDKLKNDKDWEVISYRNFCILKIYSK